MRANQVPQAWQMYQAETEDGRSASVLYNRGLVDVGPQPKAPHLHLMNVDMVEQGEDGLASKTEAAWFYEFEDEVIDVAEDAGFFPLSRVCSNGRWELSFYGSPTESLAEVLLDARPIVREREIEFSGESDPEWKYLHEYIAPDRPQPLTQKDEAA